jgi:hypothetical protein
MGDPEIPVLEFLMGPPLAPQYKRHAHDLTGLHMLARASRDSLISGWPVSVQVVASVVEELFAKRVGGENGALIAEVAVGKDKFAGEAYFPEAEDDDSVQIQSNLNMPSKAERGKRR